MASRFERFAASLLIVAVGLSTCAKCQSVPTPITTSNAEQQFLAFADSQWDYVLGCTGLTPQYGGDLQDVIWQIVPHGALVAGHQHLLGLWVPPNLIELDSSFAYDSWVVRHELLHHLLRGPPADQGGPHPWSPFAFPCQVMAFQHAVGGVMGSQHGR